MSSEGEGGGGFGWGILIGGVLGIVAGAYLASGPGREQVDSLRSRTIELTGSPEELRAKARAAAARASEAVRDPEHPVRRAIEEGVVAARRKRRELEDEVGEAGSGARVPEDGHEGA